MNPKPNRKSASLILSARRSLTRLAPVLAFGIVSCGSPYPGSPQAYQFGTDYCSDAFTRDAEALNQVAADIRDEESLKAYEARLGAFEEKYRGVRCKTLLVDRRTLESRESYINVNQVVQKQRALISQIQSVF